jgi:hypothetical protein
MKLPLLGLALLVSWMGAVGAAAQEIARKYAVVSLIGDSISVVTYHGSTASSLDRNRTESLPVSDRVFDKAALVATQEALERIEPRSTVLLLAVSSPSLYTDQERFFDGTRLALPEELVGVARREHATHMLLLTKHRGEARLQAQDEKLGSGMLAGIGFYIDRRLPTRNPSTGERGMGFLAPFVYAQMSLVDLATLRVDRQQTITATATLSPAGNPASSDPWYALSAPQKVDVLSRMVTQEVLRAVPALVAPSGAARDSRN